MKQHSSRFLDIVQDAKSRVKECGVEDLRAWMESGKEMHIIDVREESEYKAGHVPGAVHLSKGVIERDIEKMFPDPNTELVLYCGGGYRSALAADNVQKMGYTNVISMDGGWSGWKESGLPIEI